MFGVGDASAATAAAAGAATSQPNHGSIYMQPDEYEIKRNCKKPVNICSITS